jgi:DNA (cytosine-5)-methyltransferase 1
MKTIEMCAGAGGQALGLHEAGFDHEVLIEIDQHACKTLRQNNESLNLGWGEVAECDLKEFAKQRARSYQGRIDLVAGGVPCPPFSKAGLQLGSEDERDLFPTALDIIRDVRPKALMLENVPGLNEEKFEPYRKKISARLKRLGYQSEWRLLNACDFGVPQLRPRVILVGMQQPYFDFFEWPEPAPGGAPTVGEALYDLMACKGWEGASTWKKKANKVAPTLVGGSKKHGGPDLGPTRAKRQWQSLCVNGHRVGGDDEYPTKGFKGVRLRDGSYREGYEGMPLLTTRMAARIQGFPDEWSFSGSKTHAYRQIGNAFPPPVAKAVGSQIRKAIYSAMDEQRQGNAA